MDIQSLQNMLNPQPQGVWNFDNLNLPDIGADDISISNSSNTVAPPKVIEKSADIQKPKEFSIPDFENILIKTILERPEFFNKVKPILKSNIFGSIANSKLYDLICDYYAEYKTTPKISELYLQIEGISNPEMRRISKLKVEEVQKSEIVSTSFMDDYTVQYIKNQMFEQALIAGADFVDRRIESSKVKARELIEESQKVSIHTNLGDTFSNYADRLAYYQNPEKGLLYKRFQSFNRYLGEGILEGTLNVFMAPPGIGKSMFISYSIGDFLLQKKNVLLVSMEMSNFEFIKRIDSDLLSIPIYELKNPDRRNEITEKLESLKGSVGELYVQNYAPGSFSAYSLEALLDLYASNNIKIDVVMLDYLGLMKSDRVSPNVGLYSYIKSIGEEVRAVAKNHCISIFTASQLNRCFSTNTIVKTKVGHKAAKNLCIGDEILGPNGYVKVVGISPSGVKKAYKIKTKSGKEIIVSKDHRIPTNNGLKTIDEGLKIGDRVKTSGFQSVLSKERNAVWRVGTENYKKWLEVMAKRRTERPPIDYEVARAWQKYQKEVGVYTSRQNIKSLKFYDLRGRADKCQLAYHLDHKISVKFGFAHRIPPEIIGSIENLQFIPVSDNCNKRDKCWSSLHSKDKNINLNSDYFLFLEDFKYE